MAAEQKLEKPVLEKIPALSSATEKIAVPEKKLEDVLATPEKKAKINLPAEAFVATGAIQTPAAQNYQQKRAQEIDNILSEGLNEVFLKMPPVEQKIFKKKGEETASKINELLNQTKVKINKIISLIRKWLALITGINKFYLEQEVKIKADKIMRLRDK